MSSLQLRSYCVQRLADTPVETAAATSGLGLAEARLWEKDRDRGEADFTAIARAGAHAPAREGNQGEMKMTQGNIAADELRLLVERIERLKEEIKGLNDDVSDIFKEAKSRGFDTWAMKEILKWRRLETHTQQERATLLELYAQALGVTVADAEILKAA